MIRYSQDYIYEIWQHKDLGNLKVTGDGVFQRIHYYCVVSKYFFIQSKLTSTFLLHTTRLCFKSPKSPKPTASNCLYLWLPKRMTFRRKQAPGIAVTKFPYKDCCIIAQLQTKFQKYSVFYSLILNDWYWTSKRILFKLMIIVHHIIRPK